MFHVICIATGNVLHIGSFDDCVWFAHDNDLLHSTNIIEV